ncbi:uncharacterized protein Smp_200560 [Schistosoma mansoni]|uniref:uncharacterized protein n=1 Tax=Schistosoma mansoni TaxID=6183 RepID=UPI00022DC8F3|nr:uncharacterized protein Smp_200560 [Schistosoma mansoni]|eukprot:XP_018647787.1 uncharacterized protein Smp_200560 [Schistosoma mansoni]
MPSKGASGKSAGPGGSSRCSKTSTVSSRVVHTSTSHNTSKSFVSSNTITRREVQTPTSCRISKTFTVTKTVSQNPARSILPGEPTKQVTSTNTKAITKSSGSK